MTSSNHDLARRFFAALSAGRVPDDLLADDMTAWTTTSGESPRARYQGGVALLGSLFDGGFAYTIDSLSAEDDRVAAEVHAEGRLHDGRIFTNRYVFVLRVRDGRIVSVAEHFNPGPVREVLGPLIQAAIARHTPEVS